MASKSRKGTGALTVVHMASPNGKPVRGKLHKVRTVKFGTVTIESVTLPDAAVVRSNIQLGNTAFERVAATIVQPGLHLDDKADVPMYSADPDDPSRLVRRMNDKRERGHLRSGKFVIAKE